MKKIIKLKRILLCLFTFTLCYEYYDPFGVAYFLSLPKITGSLYFIISFFIVRNSFQIKHIRQYINPLIILFIFISLMSFIFISKENIFKEIVNISWLQCIVLFWLTLNDLIHDKKLQQYVLICFLASVVSVALLVNMDFSIEFIDGRLTIFGTNSNSIGMWAVYSITIIFNIIKSNNSLSIKIPVACSIPLMLMLIGKSGSRGAFIGFIIIFILYAISEFTKLKKILFYVPIIILFGYYSINKLMESNILQDRLTKTIEDKDTAGRDIIWKHAFQIFIKHPTVGVGETGYETIMKNIHGEFIDTHNLFLYFLVTGGVLCFIIFTYFMFTIIQNSIITVLKFKDILPLIMTCLLIFEMSKSGGILNSKMMWFFLAIVIAINKTHNNKIKNEYSAIHR